MACTARRMSCPAARPAATAMLRTFHGRRAPGAAMATITGTASSVKASSWVQRVTAAAAASAASPVHDSDSRVKAASTARYPSRNGA